MFPAMNFLTVGKLLFSCITEGWMAAHSFFLLRGGNSTVELQHGWLAETYKSTGVSVVCRPSFCLRPSKRCMWKLSRLLQSAKKVSHLVLWISNKIYICGQDVALLVLYWFNIVVKCHVAIVSDIFFRHWTFYHDFFFAQQPLTVCSFCYYTLFSDSESLLLFHSVFAVSPFKQNKNTTKKKTLLFSPYLNSQLRNLKNGNFILFFFLLF